MSPTTERLPADPAAAAARPPPAGRNLATSQPRNLATSGEPSNRRTTQPTQPPENRRTDATDAADATCQWAAHRLSRCPWRGRRPGDRRGRARQSDYPPTGRRPGDRRGRTRPSDYPPTGRRPTPRHARAAPRQRRFPQATVVAAPPTRRPAAPMSLARLPPRGPSWPRPSSYFQPTSNRCLRCRRNFRC